MSRPADRINPRVQTRDIGTICYWIPRPPNAIVFVWIRFNPITCALHADICRRQLRRDVRTVKRPTRIITEYRKRIIRYSKTFIHSYCSLVSYEPRSHFLSVFIIETNPTETRTRVRVRCYCWLLRLIVSNRLYVSMRCNVVEIFHARCYNWR